MLVPACCCIKTPVAVQGPLLRAAVGDILEVHLLNNLSFPINIVPAGVVSSAHQAVKVAGPGETVVYAWSVPAEVRSVLHNRRRPRSIVMSTERVRE
jgi:hypothetical protein